MRKRYWLSFDLGLRGNYEKLYEWLDNLEARECCDNTATFVTEKTLRNIEEELRAILDENARAYIIFKTNLGKSGGKFIFGKRKRAPWAGFGNQGVESGEET